MTLRADSPYTATDLCSGITAASLRTWQQHRARFSTSIRADVSAISGQ